MSRRTVGTVLATLLWWGAGVALGLSGTWSHLGPIGNWGLPDNWGGGIVANGSDSTADFATLNISLDQTVVLSTPRIIGHLAFGDVTPSHNWTLSNGGVASNTLQMLVTAGVPTITVNNQIATIGVDLIGPQGIVKNGGGTLVLQGNNSYAGGTFINAGELAISSNNNLGRPTSSLQIGNATLRFEELTTIDRQIILSSPQSTIDTSVNEPVITGAIVGAGTLNKTGGGTLRLTGVGSYQGGTVIHQGFVFGSSLNLKGNISFPTNGLTKGVLFLQTSDGTFDGTISGQGIVQKSGPGTLELTSPATHTGGTYIGEGKLTVNTSIGGLVEVATAGSLGGNATIGGDLSAAGRVAPGNSPGLVVVGGQFYLSPDGVLEIEVKQSESPGGGVAGVDFDQVQVGGVATLAGSIELRPIDGYAPALGDRVTAVVATAINPNYTPRISAPGLDAYNDNGNPNDDLAVRISALPAGNPTSIVLEYVARQTNVFIDDDNASANWATAAGWSLTRAPESIDGTLVTGNLFVPQRVAVASHVGVHSLTVMDNDAGVTVEVMADKILNAVAGHIDIADRGTIELAGGALQVAAGQQTRVLSGGSLIGEGQILGDIVVGEGAGVPAGVLSPGGGLGDDPVGMFWVDGNYSQNVGGQLAVDIRGDNSGANHDTLFVGGDITLSGTLQLDVSDLSAGEFTPGAAYALVGVHGEVAGKFDAVEVVGRDDIYFHIDYGSSSPGGIVPGTGAALLGSQQITASGFYLGDGNQDGVVNELDVPIFAAVLMDNSLSEFHYVVDGQEYVAAANFLDAFDFYRIGTPSGIRLVDFDDVPSFAEALAMHSGSSLAAAHASIADAIAAAQNARVPEPVGLGMLSLGAAFLAMTWRWPRRIARRHRAIE